MYYMYIHVVLEMYHPHTYTETVVKCINMLIELIAQIVPHTQIHKDYAPLRPIVSSVGSVTYDMANFLACFYGL